MLKIQHKIHLNAVVHYKYALQYLLLQWQLYFII